MNAKQKGVIMCKNQTSVKMGFTDEQFPAGTHMCFIYSKEEERKKIISKETNKDKHIIK